jgi:hypothetical protein
METEDDIRKRIQRYHSLLLYVTDEQAVAVIKQLIQEAEASLPEREADKKNVRRK